jgi:hypothetical protein
MLHEKKSDLRPTHFIRNSGSFLAPFHDEEEAIPQVPAVQIMASMNKPKT